MRGARQRNRMSRVKTITRVGVVLWVLLILVSFSIDTDPAIAQTTRCTDRSPACIDLHGWCGVDEFRSLLRLACPITCGMCEEVMPNDFICTDSRAECERIAKTERCDFRPLTFWRDCPVACGICKLSQLSHIIFSSNTSAQHERSSSHLRERKAHPDGTAGCRDHLEDCDSKAAAGQCTNTFLRAQMVIDCARSCGTCQHRQDTLSSSSDDESKSTTGLEDHVEVSGAPPACADKRRACSFWISVGECEQQPDAMRKFCPLSCGFCNPTRAQQTPPELQRVACKSNEVDRHDSCEEWAAAGECTLGAKLMQTYCPCACKQPWVAELAQKSLSRASKSSMNGGKEPNPSGVAEEGGNCTDAHERCSGWAMIGLCTSTPLPMRRLCPASCGRCHSRRWQRLQELERSVSDQARGPEVDGSGANKQSTTPQIHQRLAEWCRTHDLERPRRRRKTTGSADGQLPTSGRSVTLLNETLHVRRAPLDAVRLRPGTEFYTAQQLNINYLLSLSVDRLLWSFRKVAGLPTSGAPYGAWEAAEEGGYPDPRTPTRTLRGHFVGHLLSGIALGYATTGNASLSERAQELVSGLAACQRRIGSGFLSAWPSTVFDRLESGRFAEVWAPWYTMHKILAGLLDVHEFIEVPRAEWHAAAIAQSLVMYLAARVDRLRREQGDAWWQATLEVEFGGIGEVAYRLAALSSRFNQTAAGIMVRFARAFVKRRFTEPLIRGEDALGGLHSNTHLPLLINGARGADVETLMPEAALLGAAELATPGLEASDGKNELTPKQLLTASVHGFCVLSLGYSYAGALGSSVNEHWPETGASNGRSRRTSFAPKGVEDLTGGCKDLADAGECRRSAPYMLSHCAAACAADANTGFTGLDEMAEDAGDGVSLVPADSDGFHTQESCTQYNALKLNLELFARAPDSALADAFERQLLNGVLGIQHPSHPGKMVYMMPLGAGVSKARANWAGWGEAEDSFWCCYGTGVESFAKLADGTYFEQGGERPSLWVSQFVPSSLRWRAGRAHVHLVRDLNAPVCDAVTITVTLEPLMKEDGSSTEDIRAGCFGLGGCTLWLRLPSWAATSSSVHLRTRGGEERVLEPPEQSQAPMVVGRFLRVERAWEVGDSLVATFGMYAYLEPLNDWRPEFQSTFALLYGPLMLVGLMERGENSLRGSPADVRRWTKVEGCTQTHAHPRASSVPATWATIRLRGAGTDGNAVKLMPLLAVVDETYSAYFQLS